MSSRGSDSRRPAGALLPGGRYLDDSAVEAWLLEAADSRDRARSEWDVSHVALLRCGRVFTAVRVAGALVYAAAGTNDLRAVEEYLARVLRGPVFMDHYRQCYYPLMPVRGVARSEWAGRAADRDVTFLGGDSYLGVPRLSAVDETHPGHSHWSVGVDPDGDGDLCSPDAVAQLIATGRSRLLDARTEACR